MREDWRVVRLKRLCRFGYGKPLDEAGGREMVAAFGSNGPMGRSGPANTLGPCLVVGRKGSFGKVTYVAEPVHVIDTAFYVDRRLTEADLRWLFYVLSSAGLDRTSRDSAIPGLERDDAYAREVMDCPPREQRAIAIFLDRKTEKIDRSIAKKEQLVELLQERRAALIARAVTKGLDPALPIRDSGVEWIGQMPAHWQAIRTKFVAKLRSGHTPSRQHPEYWEDCTIPWFGLADVWQIRDGQREYVSETAEMISELGLANSAARLLPTGTVILSRTASVGFSAILSTDMATTQDFVNWVCGPRIRPEYLLYVFRSMGTEFRRLNMGSTHQTIYMPDVGRFSTPIPPLSEQERIVQHIRARNAETDALVRNLTEAIDRLKELRFALISAAVTGKIDVRRSA